MDAIQLWDVAEYSVDVFGGDQHVGRLSQRFECLHVLKHKRNVRFRHTFLEMHLSEKRLQGIGKAAAFKMVSKNTNFHKIAQIFYNDTNRGQPSIYFPIGDHVNVSWCCSHTNASGVISTSHIVASHITKLLLSFRQILQFRF